MLLLKTQIAKLLGLIVNNNLSWKDYLYGESWRTEANNKGLIPQLSQRAGILSKIVKTMPSHRFKQICSGLFYSKLIYCIQVFGNVWDISNYDDSNRRSTAFTKEDNRKLQVLQNKILRLKTNLPFDTSTADLLKASGDMSVQQLTAYTSLLTAQKSIFHQEPVYLADKLQLRGDQNFIHPPKYKLSICREGFLYRATALYNSLPASMRIPMQPQAFKYKLKPWVTGNVPIKPG